MKTFRKWQEDVKADGLDWNQFYKFRGDKYDSGTDLEAAIRPIVNRFRDHYGNDDELIAAMIDAIVYAVRGKEAGSRTGSTLSLAGRFRRMGRGEGEHEEV